MSDLPQSPSRFALPRGIRAALFVALFAFFMVTGSRERPWSDATPIWEVAQSLVRDGTIAIETRWPPDLPLGADGRVYALAPFLQSAVHLPGAWLREEIARLWPDTSRWSWPFAAHLGPGLLGAALGLGFLSFCRRLGVSRAAALAGLGLLAGASTIWVYARSPYSEILQATAFLFLMLQVFRLLDRPERRQAVWLGVAAGLLVGAKAIYLAALPGLGLFLAHRLWGDRQRLLRLFGWAALSFAPLLFITLLYNKLRWGAWTHAGYDLDRPVFVERPLVGLWGLFLSPGKSVFLYSPPLLLSFVALPRVWRRHRDLLVATLVAIVPVLLVYARFLFWSGDYAWGPRYLVFAVPVLLLPGIVLLDDVLGQGPGWGRRVRLAAVAAVFVAGAYVQVLGNAFHWDHFIRISMEARNNWLGWPNKKGAPEPPVNEICGACFEDAHAIQWLPPFNPIDGHHWLLGHVWANDAWQTAEANAPWKRYTSLQLNISNTYPRARLDWWFLNFWEYRHEGQGFAILGVMLASLIGSLGYVVLRGRGEGAHAAPVVSPGAGPEKSAETHRRRQAKP